MPAAHFCNNQSKLAIREMDFRYLPSSYDLSAVCQTNNDNFKNLTRSYTQQLHDATTLSASFIMFAVTAVFFILNLFSGISDVSAIIDPKVRVGLSSALSFFLPVMSYLFSEAKNKGGANDPDSRPSSHRGLGSSSSGCSLWSSSGRRWR